MTMQKMFPQFVAFEGNSLLSAHSLKSQPPLQDKIPSISPQNISKQALLAR